MIYVIEAVGTGRVKFGRAADPEKRLRELSTGSPYHLHLLASADWHDGIERLIHEAFKDKRVNGEWFEQDDYIVSFVNTMMCHNSTDALKFGACMQILVEKLTGWTCDYSLDRDVCKAPAVFKFEALDADV